MDPIAKNVVSRALTAGLERDPEKLFAQMKKAVEALLDARVESRRVRDALSEINQDATGVTWTDNYNNDEIRKARDILSELDHNIGMGFREIEFMARQLKKKVVK